MGKTIETKAGCAVTIGSAGTRGMRLDVHGGFYSATAAALDAVESERLVRLIRAFWGSAETRPYEPPTVTPIGNLNDLFHKVR